MQREEHFKKVIWSDDTKWETNTISKGLFIVNDRNDPNPHQ